MKTLNKLFVFMCLLISTYAAKVVLEAEDGSFTSVLKTYTETSGYSGSGYVGRFETAGDTLTVKTTVKETGMYDISIIFLANMGTKTNTLVINGAAAGDIVFEENSAFETKNLGAVYLKAGENTIGLKAFWGWMYVDAFVINDTPNAAKDVSSNLDSGLVNPKAIPAARKLYDFLKSVYGKKILSGQVGNAGQAGDEPAGEEIDYIRQTTGKTPAVWNTDFIFESNDPTWRPTNPSLLDGALNWWKKYEGKGIMSAQWHWNIAGKTGNYAFYSKDTTFDIEQAVIEGTWEYEKIIKDIDRVSSIIKQMQDVNMPLIWRPLHENNGDWFWWGAKPEACAKLWKILYNRMVNVNGLNNLIWLWNGNMDEYTPIEYIDLIGVDIYADDHGPQTTAYNAHFDYFDGKKMVVLSENGRIPEIQDCVDQSAWWGYFQTWNNEFIMTETYHTKAQLKTYFNHPNVLNMDELPSFDVTSYEGEGGNDDDDDNSCFSTALGYPCCEGNRVVFTDSDGEWGVENGNWCGIGANSGSSGCWAVSLGYKCCTSTSDVVFTDNDGNWGIESNEWCGII